MYMGQGTWDMGQRKWEIAVPISTTRHEENREQAPWVLMDARQYDVLIVKRDSL